MTAAAGPVPGLPGELRLLTFTMMGVRLGVDTAQIDGMATPEAAGELGVAFSPLHEELTFRGGPFGYVSPRVLMIKGETPPRGILVEAPDDITSFGLDSLRPLPPLLEACGMPGAVWGIAVRDEEVIVLLDFYKLNGPCGPAGSVRNAAV